MFVAGRLLGVAVSLAGMLAASGCGDAGSTGPRSLPPATATPVGAAASGSPSYDEDAALAAATAVVREYFRLLNRLSESMDAQAFRQLETPTCPCRKFLKSIEQRSANGESYFGRARLTSLTPDADSSEEVEVLVSYDAEQSGIRDAHGRVIARTGERTGAVEVFYVTLREGRWLISNIGIVKRGRTS